MCVFVALEAALSPALSSLELSATLEAHHVLNNGFALFSDFVLLARNVHALFTYLFSPSIDLHGK